MSTSKRKVWCSLLPWHNWSAWNWRGIGTDRQYRRCGLCGLVQERNVTQ